MKIYRKVVLRTDGSIILEDAYEYEGEIVELKGGGTSQTSAEPWKGQQPYLTDIMERSRALSGGQIKPYSGATVAPFSQNQILAQDLTTQRALQGSPLLGAAKTTAQKTLQGDYLSPESNPWLSQTYNEAARKMGEQFGEITMPGIRSAALGEKAYGGSRHGIAEGMASRNLATQLKDLGTDIYGGAYGTERGLQTQALGYAPGLAESDYADIGKLAAVGEEQQSYEQALIDEAIRRWETEQLEPWQRLGMYSNLVTGNFGGTTSSMASGK